MDGVGYFKDLSEERLHPENVGWTAEFVTAVNSIGDRRFLAEGSSGGGGSGGDGSGGGSGGGTGK